MFQKEERGAGADDRRRQGSERPIVIGLAQANASTGDPLIKWLEPGHKSRLDGAHAKTAPDTLAGL